MKYCGVTHEKGRADRIKWICPNVHMVKGKYVCDCKDPCSTATKGRTTYTYENLDFRMFPGIQRDSEEWGSLYKIRTIVERAIDHLKINMGVAGRKSRNHTTTKADVVPCRDCKPANCHCCPQHELSTIHPKSETFNCLKKYSIVITHLRACTESTPKTLIIYVNSETILNNDLFFSPYIAEGYPHRGRKSFNNYLTKYVCSLSGSKNPLAFSISAATAPVSEPARRTYGLMVQCQGFLCHELSSCGC